MHELKIEVSDEVLEYALDVNKEVKDFVEDLIESHVEYARNFDEWAEEEQELMYSVDEVFGNKDIG